MYWVLLLHYSSFSSSTSPSQSPYVVTYHKSSSPPSSSGSKINPAVLVIIVILAVIFFISGLLHLLVRFLIKHRSSSNSQSNRYPEISGSNAFQRQLQQLFHLHDSGLDQSFIDALPVFIYKEMGLEEPFDCAVCLCEFSENDKLRLLPLCGHAFHITCIDTWLLSNSTCPLCRSTLLIDSPFFDFEDSAEEYEFSVNTGNEVVSSNLKPADDERGIEKRVFSVRLGKFRSSSNEGEGILERKEEGETSSSNLNERRCYSMGSVQYVVADLNLQVALPNSRGGVKVVKERGRNGSSLIDGDNEGKKINYGSKGESFSVSKIWLWSKKGKFPSSSENIHSGSSSVNLGLPSVQRPQCI